MSPLNLERTVVDGAPCTVAEMPGGYVKLLFDDGRMVIAREGGGPGGAPVHTLHRASHIDYSPDQARAPKGSPGGGRFVKGGAGGAPSKEEEKLLQRVNEKRAAEAERAARVSEGATDAEHWDFHDESFAQLGRRDRMMLEDLQKRQVAFQKAGNPRGVRVDYLDSSETPDALQRTKDYFEMTDDETGKYVLEKGQEFPVPKEPPPVALATPKMCYENAAKLVTHNMDQYDYAEGYVVMTGQSRKTEIAGQKVELPGQFMVVPHGFAIDKATGAVVDPTLGWRPKAHYFGVRFPTRDLIRRLVKNGQYGVLTDKEGKLARLDAETELTLPVALTSFPNQPLDPEHAAEMRRWLEEHP